MIGNKAFPKREGFCFFKAFLIIDYNSVIMKTPLFFFLLAISSVSFAQDRQSVDHTAENLFSTNIEGPAFDKKGNLFVVNFQKDGTIGLVKPDGTVELFVTLPEGSTANSIQFDTKGNMFLADFTGHNVLKLDPKTKKNSVHAHSDEFNQPNDLCINKNNHLFASDPNWKQINGQIWRIDEYGKFVRVA